jgi:hypothetical protein
MMSLINHARPDYGLSFFAEDEFRIPLVPYFEHDRETLASTLDGLVDKAFAGLLFA